VIWFFSEDHGGFRQSGVIREEEGIGGFAVDGRRDEVIAENKAAMGLLVPLHGRVAAGVGYDFDADQLRVTAMDGGEDRLE
jgi:hypothetical protein